MKRAKCKRGRRVWGWLRFAAAGLGVLALAAWAISRVATDRLLITQFMFWVPSWMYFVVAAAVAMPALLCRGRTRRAALAIAVLASAGLITTLIPGREGAPPPGPGGLRIVHWNLSSPDTHAWEGDLRLGLDRPADVYFLGVTASGERLEKWAAVLGEEYTVRRLGVFAIVSRVEFEVRQFSLLLEEAAGATRATGSAPESRFQRVYNSMADRLGFSRREFDLPDGGWLFAATFEAAEGPLRVDFIDLPSNPFASRWKLTRAAEDRIGEIKAGAGLAPAMALIGDFNIPAGSASLRRLTRGMIDARGAAAARRGGAATWPRVRPFLAIDQAYIAPGMAVRHYETIDAGVSDHRAILVELTREGR